MNRKQPAFDADNIGIGHARNHPYYTLVGINVGRQIPQVAAGIGCPGFNTLDIEALAPATLFLMILLMFIGGSPGSCAGGVKTTTFGVLALSGWHRLRKRTHVNAFHRTVSKATLANTLSITLGGLVTIFTGLFLLLVLEAPHATVADRHGVFVGYFFETVSAVGTVGLSTGVTSLLAPASRILVTALMFIGRLGPLTVATALAAENPVNDWQYPEEDVMVG